MVLLVLMFRDFGEWSFDEVARVGDPQANVDAILVETNGGATTSFGYEVFLLARGHAAERSGHPVATFYGAVRSEHAYGVNLRWVSSDTLAVEYLDAQHVNWLNGSLILDGRKINIVLKPGVTDPSAPPGGMLYNLQGRPRGAVEQIVGPEPREASFASSVVRRRCSVAPWPGQLRRYAELSAQFWSGDAPGCWWVAIYRVRHASVQPGL